jgi:hypothetical protein
MTHSHPGKIGLPLLALLALVCLPGPVAAQKPPIPDGILMVGHDDPRFMPILTATFPSVAADPDFKKMLPILYIVRNDSDVAVRAFTVRWERTDPRPTARTNEPVGFYSDFFARPSQPSPLTGELPVLRPHRTQLIFPQNERWTPPGENDWFTSAVRPFAPFLHNDPDLEQEGDGRG